MGSMSCNLTVIAAASVVHEVGLRQVEIVRIVTEGGVVVLVHGKSNSHSTSDRNTSGSRSTANSNGKSSVIDRNKHET